MAILFAKNQVKEAAFSDELSRKIEHDFVQTRKEFPKYNQDELKITLSFAKYIAVLSGLASPDDNCYLKAKGLMLETIKRIEKRHSQLPQQPTAAQPKK